MAGKSKETLPESMSIPEAGRHFLGLSRGGAYDAASRGEIPYVKIGRLKRVPVRAMERMLDKAAEAADDFLQHRVGEETV